MMPETKADRARRFSIACLSSQDWEAPLPTNRQQVMNRAARAGHEVLFVETNGWLGRHVKRLVLEPDRRAALRRLVAVERLEERVCRRKAVNVLPWGQRFELSRRVNARCTELAVRLATRRFPRPVVLWAYDPCAVSPRRGLLPLVYDCVDDYAEQVGDDGRRRRIVSSADRVAASAARVVFATARPLYERQLAVNRHTHLVPNVADYDHFSTARTHAHAAPETDSLPRPILGFAGNLTAAKVDFELLAAVAAARRDWALLLVGPAGADAGGLLERLLREPNVTWSGLRSYRELPRYVGAFDVALIPYRSTDYTASCLPLKLFEYLAAGKPVVASGLPELAGMRPDVALAEGPDEFLDAVAAALELRSPEDVRRRARTAAANTWDTRTATLLQLVADRLD